MPHRRRTLSLKARKSIAQAQRRRWKIAKQKARAGENSRDVRVGKLKPGQTYSDRSAIQKNYWGSMSAAERSREIARRKLVHAGKLKPKQKQSKPATSGKVLAKGLWQSELTKLLGNGPRPRREVNEALNRRYPNKHNAITVALAAAKRNGLMSEEGGILTLKAAPATA